MTNPVSPTANTRRRRRKTIPKEEFCNWDAVFDGAFEQHGVQEDESEDAYNPNLPRSGRIGGSRATVELTKVYHLPLFGKKAGWRGNSIRMDSPTGSSAADVMRYECHELGNHSEYEHITPELFKELRDYEPLWVTRTKGSAKRYGNPVQVMVPKDARVIVADDGDGGSLLAIPRKR